MSCENPFYIDYEDSRGHIKRFKVPCGHCQSCMASRRASWSYRLFYEYLFSRSAWFVTLTYDNEHLPGDGVNKNDVQLFFKRLRKKQRFRYFLVSEYGDKFGRPHYHTIIFYPKKVDLVQCVKAVDAAWQKGNIQVGEVNMASINYCSKYSLKDRYDDPDSPYGNKTFSLMSRKPGIGYGFLDKHGAALKENQQFQVSLEGLTYNLPRYYRDKLFSKIEKLKHNLKIQEYYGNKIKCQHVKGINWFLRKECKARPLNH